MKTKDIGSELAEILNNYNHPLFEMAFQLIDDKEFHDGKESNQHIATTDGDNSRRVCGTVSSMYENHT